MIEIKNLDGRVIYIAESATDIRSAAEEARRNGAYLSGADLCGAYLCGADLCGAYLSGADLSGAYLCGADLSGAHLSGADLCGAYLSGADLSGAHLSGAHLSGAQGFNRWLTDDLTLLLDQPGKIRAYKLVNEHGEGPYNGGIVYEKGNEYQVDDASENDQAQCAAGINLASLPWCCREWRPGYRILVAEFARKDIAAIPIGTDGKFRVSRCKIVGEKDLAELGLVAG